eukprot:364479-Chlamydomonas_euryale.AAC.8
MAVSTVRTCVQLRQPHVWHVCGSALVQRAPHSHGQRASHELPHKAAQRRMQEMSEAASALRADSTALIADRRNWAVVGFCCGDVGDESHLWLPGPLC